ncbi:MAG: acylphosphatase, partial [Chloroflexota bacterium]|nr:acylphosphatase [Chloroflexota bacterium]
GRVQGVNFRNEAVRSASARQITGRVWNRDDGAVELVAEGDAVALDDLARWLREGPRLAEVEAVERTDLGGKPRYLEFTVGYRPAS